MKLTGAVILVSRGMKVLQAAPAAYPYRSARESARMFFTCHWQHRYWVTDVNPEGEPLRAAGSNLFTQRGACGGQGHVVYVISLSAGQLYLGGRMCVSQIVSRDEAVDITGNDNLYDASEWVIDDDGGTPLHLHRRLAPEVTRRITCIMASGATQGLCFVDANNLDVQATRGVRRLTQESAELLERIIAVTDAMPNEGELLTVTQEMLDGAGVA
jgi:hypothetical protein